jgi:hypothetical protein
MLSRMAELTDEHRAVLDFEGAWFKEMSPKGSAVRQQFDRSLAEHQQLVAWLIRQPEALSYAPTTVRRLQRLRDRRLAERRTGREAS